MKFQYYRFFLSPINGNGNLFTQLEDSRDNAIKEVFQNSFEGQYKGMTYSIKFIKQFDEIIYYRVAKHTSIKRNKSPEENFESEQMEHWPFVNMIISLAKNVEGDYGQIIAIEQKSSIINNPTNLLRDWADAKNRELSNYGYVVSINPISSQKTFWNVAKKYEGQIEEVVFEYSMPNLFNTGDELESELKAANSNLNASKACVSFSNKLGNLNLSESNSLLQQSAKYIDDGGGDFKIKRKNIKGYIMSAKKIKAKNIEIQDFNIELETEEGALNMLNTILKAGQQ